MPRLYRRGAVRDGLGGEPTRPRWRSGLPARRRGAQRHPAAAGARLPRSATPRLCVLSRLVPHKRIEQAIALVDALRIDHPGLLLDLVGDGWWAAELDAEIARRGLDEVVVRHGRVSRADEGRPARPGLGDGAALGAGGLGHRRDGGRGGGHPDGRLRAGGRYGRVGAGRRHRRAGRGRGRAARRGGRAAPRPGTDRGARERGSGTRGDVHLGGGRRRRSRKRWSRRATRRRPGPPARRGSGRGRPSGTARDRIWPGTPTPRR